MRRYSNSYAIGWFVVGWFGRRASSKALEQEEEVDAWKQAEAEAADPHAALKREFAAAVTRGDLGNASDVLNRYLAENVNGLEDCREDISLLEHAALARRALNEGRLNKMADILLGWKIKPPNTATMGAERMAQLPNLNALGMSSIDFSDNATPRERASLWPIAERATPTRRPMDPAFLVATTSRRVL